MKYNFLESRLGEDFCGDKLKEVRKLVDDSVSFTVVGMPGVGISTFLKYLATRDFAYIVYIDIYELPRLTTKEFSKFLVKELQGDPKIVLSTLTKKYDRVVIIFNRFDQLKEKFTRSFFTNLSSLRDVDRTKVVMIFSSNKPLDKWSPKSFDRGNLEMYSKNLYLKPYDFDDFQKTFRLFYTNLDNYILKEAFKLSGGHVQLGQLIYRSGNLTSPLNDDFVKLQLKRIFQEPFNGLQRQQIVNIVLGNKVNTDNYVSDIGVVRESRGKFELFSPLLGMYLNLSEGFYFSAKERLLMKLLKSRRGRVILKDKIFETLWPGDTDNSTDWALNALIYRLRKKLIIKGEYEIESHKGIGYLLKEI